MRARKGFTLIEIILAMTILAFVGVMFFAALTYTAQSYLAAAESVEMAQKSRLALTRCFVELQEMRDLDLAQRSNNDADEFHYLDSEGATASLVRNGGALLLNGNVLLGGVASTGNLFTYRQADGSAWNPASSDFRNLYEIEIRVVMAADYLNEDRAFTTTVNPLYTGVARAPRLQ